MADRSGKSHFQMSLLAEMRRMELSATTVGSQTTKIPMCGAQKTLPPKEHQSGEGHAVRDDAEHESAVSYPPLPELSRRLS